MKRLNIISALFVIMLLLMPVFVMADVTVTDPGLPGNAGWDVEDVLMTAITKVLLPFAGVVAVFFIIVGGFQYMFAGVNEDLVKKGKTTLKNAILGLIIVILSYMIITVTINTLWRVN